MTTLKNKVLNFKDVNGNVLTFQPNDANNDHIKSATHLNFSGNRLKSDVIKVKDKSTAASITDGTDTEGTDIAELLPRLVEALDATHILQLDGLPPVTKSAVFANRIKEISNPTKTSSAIRDDVLTLLETELNTYTEDRTDIFRLYATSLLAIANVRLSGSGAASVDADAQIQIKLNLAKRHNDYAQYIQKRLETFGKQGLDANPANDAVAPDLNPADLEEMIQWKNAPIGGGYNITNINTLYTNKVIEVSELNNRILTTYGIGSTNITAMNDLLLVELEFFLKRINNNWITGTDDNSISGIGDIHYIFQPNNTNILNTEYDPTYENSERVQDDGSGGTVSKSVDLSTVIGDDNITVHPDKKVIKSLQGKTISSTYNTTSGLYINDSTGNYNLSHIHSSVFNELYKTDSSVPTGFDEDENSLVRVELSPATGSTGLNLLNNLSLRKTIGGQNLTGGVTEVDRLHVVTPDGNLTGYDDAGSTDVDSSPINIIYEEYDTEDANVGRHIKTNNSSIKARMDVNNSIFDNMVDQMRELGWLSYISQN